MFFVFILLILVNCKSEGNEFLNDLSQLEINYNTKLAQTNSNSNCRYLLIVDIGHADVAPGTCIDTSNNCPHQWNSILNIYQNKFFESLAELMISQTASNCSDFRNANIDFQILNALGNQFPRINEASLNYTAAIYMYHHLSHDEDLSNVDFVFVKNRHYYYVTGSGPFGVSMPISEYSLYIPMTNIDLTNISELSDQHLSKSDLNNFSSKGSGAVNHRAVLINSLIELLNNKRTTGGKNEYENVAVISLHFDSINSLTSCQTRQKTRIFFHRNPSELFAKDIENKLSPLCTKHGRTIDSRTNDQFIMVKTNPNHIPNADVKILIECAFLCSGKELIYLSEGRMLNNGDLFIHFPHALYEFAGKIKDGILDYFNRTKSSCDPSAGRNWANSPGNAHPDDFTGLSYSVPIQNPSDPSYETYGTGYGTSVAILNEGYHASVYEMLSEYRHLFSYTIPDFSPSALIEDHPVFILPSASLFSLDNSYLFKKRLETYVENGGTVLVFSQQHGDDYTILPRGDELSGYGWSEDISCNFRSAAIASYAHLFSGQEDVVFDLNIDGFFTRIPDDSSVYLSRIRDGTPCLFSYPFGDGKVIVSTCYLDFAHQQGSSTPDEHVLLRDLVEWSVYGSVPSFFPDTPLSLPVELTNDSSESASRALISILNPKKEIIDILEVKINLDPHETKGVTLDVGPLPFLGYYTIEYLLMDDSYNPLFMVGNSSPFVISSFSGDEQGCSYLPELGFALTSEREYYPCGSEAEFTFHIWNRSQQDRTIRYRLSLPHNGIYSGWQDIYIPHGQEVVFTRSFSPLYSYDRVWAWFYEGDTPVGNASRGFYVFDPSFDIDLLSSKTSYGKGDEVTVTASITNTLPHHSPAHVILTCFLPDGGELFSEERMLEFEGNETREESFHFTIPTDCEYGTLKVLAQMPRACGVPTMEKTIRLPVNPPTHSMHIDTSRIGDNEIGVTVTNTGEPGIHDGILSIQVDRDGIEYVTESRSFTLAGGESNILTFSVPFNSAHLSVYEIHAQTNYGSSARKVVDTRPHLSISLHSHRVRVTEMLEGILTIDNTTAFSRHLTIEMTVNELGIYEQYTTSLDPYEMVTIPFALDLPEDASWDTYSLTCTVLSGGTSLLRSSHFAILPPSLSVHMEDTGFTAGDTLTVTVENSGGCTTEFDYTISLFDAKNNEILFEWGMESILPDKSLILSFLLPEDCTDGHYTFYFEGWDHKIHRSFHLVKKIHISGKKSLLSVTTSNPIFFEGEDIHCLVDIQNQDGPYSGELLLEIVQDESGGEEFHVAQGMVVWSTMVVVTVDESQNLNLEFFAPIDIEGLLILRGRLFTLTGQEMAIDEQYFYYFLNELAITVNTDKEVYWPQEQVNIWGELINVSENPQTGSLTVFEEGELLSISFDLQPGESITYATSMVAEYETTVYVEANSVHVCKIIHVEEPRVFSDILFPHVVDHNPFTASLVLENPGKRAVSLNISFYGMESLVILPGETTIIEREIQITEDTVLQAIVTGDVSHIVERMVFFEGSIHLSIAPESSYPLGTVEIPFMLSHEGSVDSSFWVEFQFDSHMIKREYIINAGESISDTLTLSITEGPHLLTVKTPLEELQVDIEGIVIIENHAELQVDIPENAGETLTFSLTVENTGSTVFAGRVTCYTTFWGESVDIEIPEAATEEFMFELPTEPGTFSLNIELTGNGELVDKIFREIEAQHPPPYIQALSVPSQIYQAGEENILSFTLENSGGKGVCEFFLDIPGIYNRKMTFFMEKKGIKSIDFTVLFPKDIPSGEYDVLYSINGVISTFEIQVIGVEITVSASLDRTIYDEGDIAFLTIWVAPAHSCKVKVNYGNYYAEEECEETASLAIPVDETGDIFYAVYDADTQRSLHISSILLQVRGDLSVYTDKLIYAPGEEVTVTVEPPTPGILTVYWNSLEPIEISSPFQFSFTIPPESRSETLKVYYDFIGENGLISSFFPVKVQGYLVKVHRCSLDKSVYDPTDTVHAHFIFASTLPVQTTFSAHIYDPKGNILSTYHIPLSLDEGKTGFSLDLEFSTAFSGSHILEYSLATPHGVLLIAKDYFDVSGPVILGIHTPKNLYMQGEPVSGYVDLYGTGTAYLTLYMDDTVLEKREVILSGYEIQPFQIYILEGDHEIRAELLSETKSTAHTYILVMSNESAQIGSTPENNPDVDMKPVARYHIEQAKKLKEYAESLLDLVEGADGFEIEALLKKANDYLDVAESFLETVPTIANNWALEAINIYNEVIALLETLLNE